MEDQEPGQPPVRDPEGDSCGDTGSCFLAAFGTYCDDDGGGGRCHVEEVILIHEDAAGRAGRQAAGTGRRDSIARARRAIRENEAGQLIRQLERLPGITGRPDRAALLVTASNAADAWNSRPGITGPAAALMRARARYTPAGPGEEEEQAWAAVAQAAGQLAAALRQLPEAARTPRQRRPAPTSSVPSPGGTARARLRRAQHERHPHEKDSP